MSKSVAGRVGEREAADHAGPLAGITTGVHSHHQGTVLRTVRASQVDTEQMGLRLVIGARVRIKGLNSKAFYNNTLATVEDVRYKQSENFINKQ